MIDLDINENVKEFQTSKRNNVYHHIIYFDCETGFDEQGKHIPYLVSYISNTDSKPTICNSFQKFINSIRTGKEHPTSISDNFWTISIMFAAIQSFESKKIVKIDDFMSKIYSGSN